MREGDYRLRRSLFLSGLPIVVMFATLAFALGSCTLSTERVAPFSGTVITAPDSTLSADTTISDHLPFSVDLVDVVGYVIYDKQIDGLFDDTVVFYGDEQGNFNGLLQYEFPLNITAPRLKKHVRLIFPELGVDTFLSVNIYSADSDAPNLMNQWDTLVLTDDSTRPSRPTLLRNN